MGVTKVLKRCYWDIAYVLNEACFRGVTEGLLKFHRFSSNTLLVFSQYFTDAFIVFCVYSDALQGQIACFIKMSPFIWE